MKYNQENVYQGDYVRLSTNNEWYKVEYVSDTYIDLVDDFGNNTDAEYREIAELKLESEIAYNF